MNWLNYLLEANLYLCLFYAGYVLILSKLTFYNLNRVYLLGTCFIAFVIPLFQIGFLKQAEIFVPVAANQRVVTAFKPGKIDIIAQPALLWQQVLLYIYLAGVGISLILFSLKLYELYRLTKRHQKTVINGCTLIRINEHNTAFSFFNYLYIGKNLPDTDIIIKHEQVHARQKHSIDILFMELVKAINWFNPIVYLFQNNLKTLHEYIADGKSASFYNDKLSYSTFLLKNAYGTQGISFANSFFNHNLLKNRIMMLNKQSSGKLARLKYLLTIPLLIGMLCSSTLGFSKNYGISILSNIQDTLKEKSSKNVSPTPAKPIVKNIKPQENQQKEDIKSPEKQTPKPVAENIKSTSPTENGDKKNSTSISIKSAYVDIKGTPFNENPLLKLYKYISTNARYPTKAFESKTVGSVNIDFEINDKGKIDNVTLISGIGNGCDKEAVRVMKNYPETLRLKPGPYRIGVVYTLALDGNRFISGPPPVPQIDGQSAGVVYVTGFTKL